MIFSLKKVNKIILVTAYSGRYLKIFAGDP